MTDHCRIIYIVLFTWKYELTESTVFLYNIYNADSMSKVIFLEDVRRIVKLKEQECAQCTMYLSLMGRLNLKRHLKCFCKRTLNINWKVMWGSLWKTWTKIQTCNIWGDTIHPSRNPNLYWRVVKDEPLPSNAVGWPLVACVFCFLPTPLVLGLGRCIPWISS